MDQTDPAIMAELRRLLADRGINEYQLRVKHGIASGTARKALGKVPGSLSPKVLDELLGVLGLELWHRKRRR